MTAPTSTAATATSTGIAPNVGGALAYALGPITGVAFLVLEKENRFVRFHAAQSIVAGVLMIALSVVLSVVGSVLAFVPILGWLAALAISLVVGLGSLALWLVLMWRAFQGQSWHAPIAGALAERFQQ